MPVHHSPTQARAVSDRVGDLCHHDRRLQPGPVQAASGGSTGDVTGPGPFHRPRKGRPVSSPQRGVEGRIRPQRRNNSGGLKLKQPVLIALFIARRLGEATASEKAEAIRTAHVQLKELKAMGGKGGFVQLPTGSFPPRPLFGLGSATRASPPPHHASGGFGGEIFSSGASDFGSAYTGAYGGGGGHASGGAGHYGPTNGRSHRGLGGRGGRGGRGGGSGRGPAVYRKCTLAGSTPNNHPHTICPLNECFKCGKSGLVRQLCTN